jgi:hypothetical protein
MINIKVPKGSSRRATQHAEKSPNLEVWRDNQVSHTQPNDSYIGSDVADEFEY